jgi:heme exporter protein CcmD
MMDAMPFVLGSYVVTAIVVLVEIVAVRARLRAATRAVAESGGDPLHAANPEPHR